MQVILKKKFLGASAGDCNDPGEGGQEEGRGGGGDGEGGNGEGETGMGKWGGRDRDGETGSPGKGWE